MYQTEVTKKERRKVIIAAALVVSVILGLIVAIVVVATNKARGNWKTANTEETPSDVAAVVDDAPAESMENSTEEEAATEELPVETQEEETPVIEVALPAQTIEEDIPTTGPAEAWPLALLGGAAATYLASVVMSKREATTEIVRQ